MDRARAETSVTKVRVGYRPKHYYGQVTIGRRLRTLRVAFDTATEAQRWARRVTTRWNGRVDGLLGIRTLTTEYTESTEKTVN